MDRIKGVVPSHPYCTAAITLAVPLSLGLYLYRGYVSSQVPRLCSKVSHMPTWVKFTAPAVAAVGLAGCLVYRQHDPGKGRRARLVAEAGSDPRLTERQREYLARILENGWYLEDDCLYHQAITVLGEARARILCNNMHSGHFNSLGLSFDEGELDRLVSAWSQEEVQEQDRESNRCGRLRDITGITLANTILSDKDAQAVLQLLDWARSDCNPIGLENIDFTKVSEECFSTLMSRLLGTRWLSFKHCSLTQSQQSTLIGMLPLTKAKQIDLTGSVDAQTARAIGTEFITLGRNSPLELKIADATESILQAFCEGYCRSSDLAGIPEELSGHYLQISFDLPVEKIASPTLREVVERCKVYGSDTVWTQFLKSSTSRPIPPRVWRPTND